MTTTYVLCDGDTYYTKNGEEYNIERLRGHHREGNISVKM